MSANLLQYNGQDILDAKLSDSNGILQNVQMNLGSVIVWGGVDPVDPVDPIDPSSFAITPDPITIGSTQWSFTKGQGRGDSFTEIVSRESEDNGATWIERNKTYYTSFATKTDVYGNGIIAGVSGSWVWYKNIDIPESDWIQKDISNIPGGFVGGGINFLNFDEYNSEFIINKDLGRDLYTSDNLAIFNSVNSSTQNPLRSLIAATTIINNGSLYVAYGEAVNGDDTPSGYGLASSPDLLNWSYAGDTPFIFYDFVYFKNAWFATATDSSGGISVKAFVMRLYRSTDFISWTEISLSDITIGTSNSGNIIVSGNRLIIMSSSLCYESTDGLSFSKFYLPFNVFDYTGTLIKSRSSLLSQADSLGSDSYRFRNMEYLESGGKVISWGESPITQKPVLEYPSSSKYNSLIGFTQYGNATSLNEDGFQINNTSVFFEGFYLRRSGVYYTEFTLNANADGVISPKIGVDIPFHNFLTTNGLTYALLENNKITTSNTDVAVDYQFSDSDVIGVLFDIDSGTVSFYSNGNLIESVSGLATEALWTQKVSSTRGSVLMNIGNEEFKHNDSSATAWADEWI